MLFILTILARATLLKYKPKVIAITGSVGKTSAKDLIFSVVSSSFYARKSEKSFNSEFGVPLTILGLPNAWRDPLAWLVNFFRGLGLIAFPHKYPKWLVLEMGADHPGDIKSLVSWVRPRIGVLTGLGSEVPVHIEFFPSIESLVKEKSELLRNLDSFDIAIINCDDERAWHMRGSTQAQVLSYGFAKVASVQADSLHVNYDTKGPVGMGFRIDYDGKSLPIRLFGVLGKGHAYAAMAAFATGAVLGINLVSIAEALARHTFAPGRMRILEGLHSSVLIDDTYNSSPSAVKLALESLQELNLAKHFPNGRKIVVLGDMLELGEYSQVEHEKVGTRIRGVVDVLVCVGKKAHTIGESALVDGMQKDNVIFFDNSREAGVFLADMLTEGDIVLLKGSQSMRMERATEILLADHSKTQELLVRQEKEWKARK